jgi:CRP-like cAMP-binding protein
MSKQNMKQIREYFEQLVGISDKDWALFASKLKKNDYPKKSSILKVGETESHLSFIEKGAVRLFIPKIENDLTFGFCFQGQFVSAYDSFLSRQACSYEVETMTSTSLWRISYEDLQFIYANTKVGNTIGRLAAESQFLIKSERELSFLEQTAEERYRALFNKRPNLILQIPLKYIASYVGVTPQALSRIRKRIS